MALPVAASAPHHRLAELREALAARFHPATPEAFTQADESCLRTGFEQLDRALAGGFPRGVISTLEGPASSGRATVGARLLAAATSRGLAAVIDDGSLHPPSLAAAGVRLERLLVVRANEPLGVARAADIVLRAASFSVVLIPALALKAAAWTRLANVAQRANAVLVALGSEVSEELRYFASLRVDFGIERVFWSGESGVFCALAGYDVRATVVKHKRAVPGKSALFRCTAFGGLPERAPLRASSRDFLPRPVRSPRERSALRCAPVPYRRHS